MCSTLAKPYPSAFSTVPRLTIATATPGTCCRFISARTNSSMRAAAGFDAGATVCDPRTSSVSSREIGSRIVLLDGGLRAGLDQDRLARTLEKREARTILPRQRTAEPAAVAERLVLDPRHERFVSGLALVKPREVAEIRARREHDVDAGNRGDLIRDLDADRRLDHDYDEHIVVGGVAIVLA